MRYFQTTIITADIVQAIDIALGKHNEFLHLLMFKFLEAVVL